MDYKKFGNEYAEACITTAIYPRKGSNYTYTVLGLANELGELYEKMLDSPTGLMQHQAQDEIGDCLWYCAMTVVELDVIDFGDIYDDAVTRADRKARGFYKDAQAAMTDALIHGLKVTGIAKKAIRDNGGILASTSKDAVCSNVSYVVQSLAIISDAVGLHINDIALRNLEKLNDRKERGVLSGDGDKR